VLPGSRIGAVALTLLLLTTPSTGADDPTRPWSTLETPHFRIHFEERNRPFALRLAPIAEAAHLELVPRYGETADSPVDVVVVDDADIANGSAGVTPYDAIRVNVMPPVADSSLGDSDDWLRGLFLHEYIHILHLDHIGGLSAALNRVFGKTYAPNQGLPRWMTEGIATWGESLFTEGGRLRNNAFRMWLRMDALANDFRGTERLSGSSVTWPGGNAWYLYGSDFVDYVARTRGENRWYEFMEVIGDTIVPLAVNHSANEVFGATILELWEEYAAAAQGEFQAEAVGVMARRFTPVDPLTTGAYQSAFPRCSGSELAFLHSDGRSQPAIHRRAPDGDGTVPLADVFGNGSFDISDDGRTLIVSQNTDTDQFLSFNDLFLFDPVAGGRPVRLTHGERAREPALSPDDRRVAYVAMRDDGGADLRELELGTGAIRLLAESESFSVASTPSYSPDGRYLAYSLWELDWGRDIVLLDVLTGESSRLTHDRAQDLDPTFSPDGDRVFWASDRTGIYNAHAIDLERAEVEQLTNVLGGVFAPRQCVDDGPLWVRTYGPEGYDIGSVEADPRPATVAYQREEHVYPTPEQPVILEERRYRPGGTLYPRSWAPVLSQEGDSFLVGASVAGFDPAGHHSYTAAIDYTFGEERPSGGLSYSFRRLPVNVSAYFTYAERTRQDLFAESRFVPFEVRRIGGGASLSMPFFDESTGHALRLGYDLRYESLLDPLELDHDPSDLEPSQVILGRSDDITFGWTWRSARRYAYSLSSERGTQLGANLRLRSPADGSGFDSFDVSWTVRQYLEMPWLHGHVVAVQLTGGIGRGAPGRQPGFSIGGPPEQDVLLSLIEETPVGSGFLRGYPRGLQSGRQFHLMNVEYRLPLVDIDIGPWTLPFFMRRLYLAPFVDYGIATNDIDGFNGFRTGVGGELRLQTTIGYTVPADLRLGYAYGFSDDALSRVYLLYGGAF